MSGKISGENRRKVNNDITYLFEKQDQYAKDYPRSIAEIARHYDVTREAIYQIIRKKYGKDVYQNKRQSQQFCVRSPEED